MIKYWSIEEIKNNHLNYINNVDSGINDINNDEINIIYNNNQEPYKIDIKDLNNNLYIQNLNLFRINNDSENSKKFLFKLLIYDKDKGSILGSLFIKYINNLLTESFLPIYSWFKFINNNFDTIFESIKIRTFFLTKNLKF